MRGNIVLAAATFAAGFILGCVVLVWGFDRALLRHGELVREAGRDVGGGLGNLRAGVDRHGQAVVSAGEVISKPRVTHEGPVPILSPEPLRVRGVHGEDGSLPVDVQILGNGK